MTHFIHATADQIWAACAWLFAAALGVILVLGRMDRRRLGGDRVWSKPMKFALSLCVHFATFALIARGLPEATRDSIWLQVTALISSAAALFEVGYISLQAARGRHSHFNAATRFESAMAMLMALGAVLILLPSVIIGFVWLIGPVPQWPWSVRAGVITGLLGSAFLTLTTGMAMGAARNRFVAGMPKPSRTLWLTGWSLDGGDMRPAHFLAVHMMQVVPGMAVVATMVFAETIGLILVAVVSIVWIMATLGASKWATSKRPMPLAFNLAARAQSEL